MTPDADFQTPIERTQGDFHGAASTVTRSRYRRLKLLLAGLLSALIAGLAFYFATPTQFSACALILIARDAPFIAFQADSDDRGSDRFVETQIELIRSPAILNPVVGNANAAACAELRESVAPIAHLQDRLLISQIFDSDLYEIRYASASAEDAATIVNAVMSAYLSSAELYNIDAVTRVINVLDAELRSREADLARLHESVYQLSRETNGPNPFSRNAESRNEDRYELTSDLRRKASSVEVELALLGAEQRRLESSPSNLTDVDALVELEVQNHPPIIEAQLAVDEIQLQVDQLKQQTGGRETDENSALVEMKGQLGERRGALDQLKTNHRELVRHKHAKVHAQERFQTLESLRNEIAALNVKKGVLATCLDEAERQLEADRGKLVQLEFALAKLDREKRVFELIAARKLSLETERRAPARVKLMVSASPPATTDPRVSLWKLGLVCGIAFLLPFIVAGFCPARAT